MLSPVPRKGAIRKKREKISQRSSTDENEQGKPVEFFRFLQQGHAYLIKYPGWNESKKAKHRSAKPARQDGKPIFVHID